MTLEEINILLDDLRDTVDKADRLADKLAANPLYTKEMAQKVDKARLELENKIAGLKAERKELQNKKIEPTPITEPNTNPEPTPEPTPEPPRDTILGSVGVKGKNDPKDVELVQKLLNERKGCKLDIDGKCGGKTNNQIIDLQRRLTQKWYVDGRVDPNGATWKWLKGTGALPGLPPMPPPPPVVIPPVVPPVPNPIVNPTIQEKIVDVLGEFSTRVLPYEKEFFNFSWDTPKLQIGWGFFIRGNVGALSNASLTGSRAQNRVLVTGNAHISASASVTIGWGQIYEGWVGRAGVEASGTLKGGIEANFNINATLMAAGQSVSGTINSSANIKATLVVSAQVKVVAEVGYFGGELGWESKEYRLGEVIFLMVTTPAYTATYNFSAKKFSFSNSGAWRVEVHPLFSFMLKSKF
jgi:hypothetical protein